MGLYGAGQSTRRPELLAGVCSATGGGRQSRCRQRRAVSRAGELFSSQRGGLIGFHPADQQSALWWVFRSGQIGFLRAMLGPPCVQLDV